MNLFRSLLSHVGWWDAFSTRGSSRVLAVNAVVDATGTGVGAVCLPFFAVSALRLKPSQFALMLTAIGVAELLATVPAGAWASRAGVWRFSIATRLGRAAAFTLMAFASSYLVVLALAVGVGLLRAGGTGLTQSLVVAVVGDEQRSNTLAVNRALRNVGYLISSGLGALLLLPGSPLALRTALVLDAMSFLVGAACIARLRPQRVPRSPDRLNWSVLCDLRYLGLIAASAVFASSILILDVAIPLWVIRHGLLRWVVAAVAALNTVLVILLQYWFSQQADTVPKALRALRWSVAAFSAMAGLVIVSGATASMLALVAVLGAGVLLTVGEMTESPAWWTLSYQLAPRKRASEYLAAFDLGAGLASVVGPLALALVVDAGWLGWASYAGVIVLAGACVHLLVHVPRVCPTAGQVAA